MFGLPLIGCAQAERFTLNINVVDEETLEPIENAKVVVSFSPGGKFGGASFAREATTDSSGSAVIKGESIFEMPIAAKKDGWYWSRAIVPNRVPDEKANYYTKHNQIIEIKLRKIKNPIPMYAKRVQLVFPEINTWIGFDFKEGDWVTPFGSGSTSMIEFKMTKEVRSSDDYTQILDLKFPNEGDGIRLVEIEDGWLKSEFIWPFSASINDLDKAQSLVYSREPKKGISSRPGGHRYLLRVNTQLDSSGNVISCNYVRIEDEIAFFGVLSAEPGLKFTYYFNPTPNDRNLEFDPEQNLFGALSWEEKVEKP